MPRSFPRLAVAVSSTDLNISNTITLDKGPEQMRFDTQGVCMNFRVVLRLLLRLSKQLSSMSQQEAGPCEAFKRPSKSPGKRYAFRSP